MKIYRDCIRLFLPITFLFLVLLFCFPVGTIKSNFVFSVFGSALVTLMVSSVSYLSEKEKIFTALGLKSVSLYVLLVGLKKVLEDNSSYATEDSMLSRVIACSSAWSQELKKYELTFTLYSYCYIFNCKWINKILKNKEPEMIVALFSIDSNLIHPYLNLFAELDIVWRQIELTSDSKEQEEKRSLLISKINLLKESIEAQIIFLDGIIQQLFSYGYFKTSWKDIKNSLKKNVSSKK